MVRYEWDVETVTTEETALHDAGEVLDHHHTDTFKEAAGIAGGAPPAGCRFQIVLVRDDDGGRSWAYVEGGQIAAFFEDTYGNRTAKVPKKYTQEVARRATKRSVDAALRRAGIAAEVFQGDGYVYFDGDDIDYSRDVSAYGVFKIADLPVERWVQEVRERCK